MRTKTFYVSIRQEFNQRDGAEFRVTINRESLTVDAACAKKLYAKCMDWDVDYDSIGDGIIVLHGSFEVVR